MYSARMTYTGYARSATTGWTDIFEGRRLSLRFPPLATPGQPPEVTGDMFSGPRRLLRMPNLPWAPGPTTRGTYCAVSEQWEERHDEGVVTGDDTFDWEERHDEGIFPRAPVFELSPAYLGEGPTRFEFSYPGTSDRRDACVFEWDGIEGRAVYTSEGGLCRERDGIVDFSLDAEAGELRVFTRETRPSGETRRSEWRATVEACPVFY